MYPSNIPEDIGFIDYLNSLPITQNLNTGVANITPIFGTPSQLGSLYAKGLLNCGMMSTFQFLRFHSEFEFCGNICIKAGCAKILSVLLASPKPIEQLHDFPIVLTEESITGVVLLKLLLAKRYKIQPRYFQASQVQANQLFAQGNSATFIIGDRALAFWDRHRLKNSTNSALFIYDLVSLWTEWTGLPFVFAIFASRKGSTVPSGLIDNLNENLRQNLESIDRLIESCAFKDISSATLRAYFELLSYRLDGNAISAISTFGKLCKLELSTSATLQAG